MMVQFILVAAITINVAIGSPPEESSIIQKLTNMEKTLAFLLKENQELRQENQEFRQENQEFRQEILDLRRSVFNITSSNNEQRRYNLCDEEQCFCAKCK